MIVTVPPSAYITNPTPKTPTTNQQADIARLPNPENIVPLETEISNSVIATTPIRGMIFHHSDHLGSTSTDTNEIGTEVERTSYFPFGTDRNSVTNISGTNPYKYTGKELDEESSLYYYESRYYDPLLKRFTSVDPIRVTADRQTDPQSLNLYAYVRNNPIKYVDPTGEKTEIFLRFPNGNESTDFGHAMIKINDNIYGFNNRGHPMRSETGIIQNSLAWDVFGDFIKKNVDSVYMSYKLNITDEQEKQIKEHLDYWNLRSMKQENGKWVSPPIDDGNQPPIYKVTSFNCTTYLQDEILKGFLNVDVNSGSHGSYDANPSSLSYKLFRMYQNGDSLIKSVYGGYIKKDGTFNYVKEDSSSQLTVTRYQKFYNKITKEYEKYKKSNKK